MGSRNNLSGMDRPPAEARRENDARLRRVATRRARREELRRLGFPEGDVLDEEKREILRHELGEEIAEREVE